MDQFEAERMPVIFFGHGSPMNAIEENDFSLAWMRLGSALPRPRAVLCVSAHWLTEGSPVGAMEKPRTIHDFGGFPRDLFAVEYPSPGSPALAAEVAGLLAPASSSLDLSWGLDHGTWSVLRRVFPDADIPIVQLGIDISRPGPYHLELAARLSALRDRGVLVVGSGNIVHNLGRIAWDRMDGKPFGFDWALEFDDLVGNMIAEGRDRELADWGKLGKSAALSIPTSDHFLPLLYVLGLRDGNDEVTVFNKAPVGGSITMSSYLFGKVGS